MSFEDAIAALGAEFGVALSDESGTVSFEVAPEDGDFEPVNFTLTYEPDDEVMLVSADVGEVDLQGGDEALLKMLEANHMFSGTMGASFCIDDGHAKLQRRIRLDTLWREGGKGILMSLFKLVQTWRQENKAADEPV